MNASTTKVTDPLPCPRCRSNTTIVRAVSPKAGVWTVYGCDTCFYTWRSMLQRAFDPVNRADAFMFRNFFVINGMHRVEVGKRDHFPLGDPGWNGTLLKAA